MLYLTSNFKVFFIQQQWSYPQEKEPLVGDAFVGKEENCCWVDGHELAMNFLRVTVTLAAFLASLPGREQRDK